MTMCKLETMIYAMMQMFKGTEATIAKSFGGKADYSDPTFKMMVMSGADAPLRAAVLSSSGMFPANLAEGMLAIANGHPLQGIKKMVKNKGQPMNTTGFEAPRVCERGRCVPCCFYQRGCCGRGREGCIFIMPLFLLGCALGLALPGDFGEVPAKIWYLQKVEK